MSNLKTGDKFTISGVHRLPDGSLRFGKPHKRHRTNNQPVFTFRETTEAPKEYTLAANYKAKHNRIRTGCKVFLVGGFNGDGFERRKFLVRFQDGTTNVVWVATRNLENFRPSFIPDHVREHFDEGYDGMDRIEAVGISKALQDRQ